jgi:hypothetical protein
MGWWTADVNSEAYIGDEPLDLVDEMLQALVRVYEANLGRKPKLSEVMRLLELSLGTATEVYLADGNEIAISAIQARTRKRRRRQPFQEGDFFAVPLRSEPKRYGFGRVIGFHEDFGSLILIFNVVSGRVLHPEELSDFPALFPPIFCGDAEALAAWRWKVIPGDLVTEGEYPVPRFKLGGLIPGEGWRVWEAGQEYMATEDDVKDLEKLSLWSSEAIECRMREVLNPLEARVS